jgi:hypothetical protein
VEGQVAAKEANGWFLQCDWPALPGKQSTWHFRNITGAEIKTIGQAGHIRTILTRRETIKNR